MSYQPQTQRSSERGHAQIPGSFQRGARGDQVQCGAGQYRFGNFFGAGCTDASKDRRSLGIGAQTLWDRVAASGATSPYGKPVQRVSSSGRGRRALGAAALGAGLEAAADGRYGRTSGRRSGNYGGFNGRSSGSYNGGYGTTSGGRRRSTSRGTSRRGY